VTGGTADLLRAAADGGGARLRWPTAPVHQQLITVQPTYLLTVAAGAAAGASSGKMCSQPAALSYGGRAEFGRGHAEITRDPALTMEQEFRRNDRWANWDGVRCSAAEEWDYVMGEAVEGGPAGAGGGGHAADRDAGNSGRTAGDFLGVANEMIRKRLFQQRRATMATMRRVATARQNAMRKRAGRGAADGGSGSGGADAGAGNADGSMHSTAAHERQEAAEERSSLLLLEEVIAIRLYSGPAYVPVNTFLREVAKLSSDWRSKLARDPKTTYSATVGWLISGIRKLSRVTRLSKLYRGVKGQLPEAFAVPDVQGMVSATDFGFMSTSRSERIPLNFMSKAQPNVLWELECREEDEAHHNGADIAIISQFPGEEEVLFPPLTMMVAASGPQEELRVTDEVEGGVQFQRIGVVPYYI
jgi:hypothetical protein